MGCTVELALPPRISLPYQSRSDVAPSRSDRARPAVGSRLDCRPEATGAHAAAFLLLVWCWPHPGFAGTEARFVARMITKLLSSRLPCPDSLWRLVRSSAAVDFVGRGRRPCWSGKVAPSALALSGWLRLSGSDGLGGLPLLAAAAGSDFGGHLPVGGG